MPITYGSVCSGIEAATQAWHPLGMRAAWFAEIEPFPSAVLAHHYPNVPNHGDMTKLAALVLERSGYYNSGCSNIAVPADLVARLAVDIEYDTREFGICLPNNAKTWKQLLAAVICKPDYPSRPEHRGVRYSKEAA